MDVLLAHAHFLGEDLREQQILRPYPPLGILYLSAWLKARDVGVGLFDSTFARREDFAALLARDRPPVVGLYVNMMTRASALKMIHACREHGALVVLGGPEPANYAEEFLARGADVIVVGEGEATLTELLECHARRGRPGLADVRGLVFRDPAGKIVRTPPRPLLPDLDLVPFPDRAGIDLEPYLRTWRERHGASSVSLITARGCPYTCTWCSHAVYGHTHRRRSVRNVVDEVEHILATWRPDQLWFADDVFTIHHRWLFEYAAEMRRRGLHAPFETITREDRLNEDVVRCLAELGCRRLWIGAESGSQRILDAMQRRTSAARTREMVRLLQRHGIEAGTFVMLGYDGEEVSDIEETVRHLQLALPDHVLTTLAYPIQGTPWHAKVRDRVVHGGRWEEGSDQGNTVAGRHSRRFYRHANRWLMGEVELLRERRRRPRSWPAVARAFVRARSGRLGMLLTGREVEPGPS